MLNLTSVWVHGPVSGRICTCLGLLICFHIQTGAPLQGPVEAMGVNLAEEVMFSALILLVNRVFRVQLKLVERH